MCFNKGQRAAGEHDKQKFSGADFEAKISGSRDT